MPNTNASTMPTTAQIHARLTAVPAMPLNPSKAAMIATTKNVTAQEIISILHCVISKSPDVSACNIGGEHDLGTAAT